MLDSLANLAAAGVVLCLSVGLGHVILNLIGIRRLVGRHRVAFATAVGVMTIALTTLGLGHAGVLYPWLFRSAAAVGFLAVIPALFTVGRQLRGQNLIQKFLGCSLFEKILIILVMAQLCAMLLAALAPPIGADALAYHLAVPKIYIDNHAIINLPNHKHAAQPFLMEMIFLFAMLLKNDIVGQLLNCAITGAAGVSVYLLARRLFSRRTAITAAAIFMLTPALIASVELLGPESTMTFFIVLTFIGLAHWTKAEKPERVPWVILLALLSAGVAGMKQSGVGHVFLLVPAVLLVPVLIFEERLGSALRCAALYAAIAAVFGGGWYFRCYVMSGNPLHPFGSLAPIGGLSEGSPGMGRTVTAFLAYPWNITMNSRNFGTLTTSNPGPLPLAFVPLLLLLFRPVPRSLKVMLLYAAAFAAAIFLTSQRTRYLIPIFGLTAIVAAVAIERVRRLGRFPGLAAAGAVIVASVVQVGLSSRSVAADGRNRLKVVAGAETREQFLSKASYSFAAFDFLNRAAPRNSRVMLLYGHEAYYLDLPYLIAGFTMVGSPLSVHDYRSNETFCEAVERLNIDYVFVDGYVRDLFYKHRIRQNPRIVRIQDWFLETCCRPVLEMSVLNGEQIKIYKKKRRAPPAQCPTTGRHHPRTAPEGTTAAARN